MSKIQCGEDPNIKKDTSTEHDIDKVSWWEGFRKRDNFQSTALTAWLCRTSTAISVSNCLCNLSCPDFILFASRSFHGMVVMIAKYTDMMTTGHVCSSRPTSPPRRGDESGVKCRLLPPPLLFLCLKLTQNHSPIVLLHNRKRLIHTWICIPFFFGEPV
jgi:hypothetical protein